MSGKRMPQLVMDEAILLVDTYFQLQEISDGSEPDCWHIRIQKHIQ